VKRIPSDYDKVNETLERKHEAWLDREYDKFCQEQERIYWEEQEKKNQNQTQPAQAEKASEA
jgi:hypothetical protein